MRVLHVIDSLNRGGAEVMLTAMAPRFQSRGIRCDVVALMRRPSHLEQLLLDQGVNLRFSSVPALYSPRQIFALSKILKEYDIVHVHLFPAQLWTVLAAAWLGGHVPLVTTEHNTWNARRRWWLRPFDRWMYRGYRRIACNSEATKESLIAWCPPVSGKVIVIPNGIPLEAFEDARPADLEAIPEGSVRLIFVGRFEAQKDHPTLLRALTGVSGAHLILVGDGPLRGEMETLARSLGVSTRVTFLGWRSDIGAVLKAADIYVHSTHSDGFGIAACEAMAAGLPVVASDVPGLSQLVAGVGVLFPEGDDKALAQALSALIHSPEQQQRMREAGLRRARQLSIENTVDNCIQMYKSILQAGTAQAALSEAL